VLSGACRNTGRYIHPQGGCPYAFRMRTWKTSPEETTEDTAPLFAKMARVEGLALRVVEDERGDPSFNLLSLIVGWMAILQKRIGVAERRNRRSARKKAMLSSEALRMNMCDRLGGVEALERWEERARLALALAKSQHCRAGSSATSDRRSDVPFGTAPSPQRTPGSPSKAREFALARLPGRGMRKVKTQILRASPRYETPIPVWPCEVMPERFAREWWTTPKPRPSSAARKFPASEPGSPSGLKRADTRNVGGPVSSAGAVLCAFA